MTRTYLVPLVCLLSLMAGACTTNGISEERLKDEGMYWERSDVTEAAYMEGPKAQQMLQRDVANCTTDLRELDRLRALRNALPGETGPTGGVPDKNTPPGQLSQWDTPERESYLLAEHSNYDDFETCMQARGWQRMEHVPYDVAKTSRADYLKAIAKQNYQTDTQPSEPTPAPYGYVNN